MNREHSPYVSTWGFFKAIFLTIIKTKQMQKVETLVVIPHYWMDRAYHDTMVGVEAEVHSNFGHFEIIVKKMSFVGYQAFRIKPECIHDLMELIDQKVIDALVNSKLENAPHEYE